MPKKPPPPFPSSRRKVDRPSPKPPVGGKSTKSEFGDYMGGKDLGQSKGRSAAVGRRAAGIKALANNTQGKIMSTKPKPAAKKALPKSMISGSLASSSGGSTTAWLGGKTPKKPASVNPSAIKSGRKETRSAVASAKSGAQLKKDLSRVDYDALGKLMASERSKAKKTKMK